MCAHIAERGPPAPGACAVWRRMYAEWRRLTLAAAVHPDAQEQWIEHTSMLVAGADGAAVGEHVRAFAAELAALLLGVSERVSAAVMDALRAHASVAVIAPLVDRLHALLPADGPLPALNTITCVLALLDYFYAAHRGAALASAAAAPLFVCATMLLPMHGDPPRLARARLQVCRIARALLDARALADADRAAVLRVVLVWLQHAADAPLRAVALPLLAGLTAGLALVFEPCEPCVGPWGSHTAHALVAIGARCAADASPAVHALAHVLVASPETLLRGAQALLLADTDAMRAVAMSAVARAWPHVCTAAADSDVPMGALERVMELMAADDFAPTLALCRVARAAEFDALEHFVFSVMRRRGGVLPLIRRLVADEIRTCASADMLLRANNARMHLISAYFRRTSFFVVRDAVAAVVAHLAAQPVDGVRAITAAMDWLIDAAARNIAHVPPAMRAVCHDVYVHVCERFAEHAAPHRALVALLMLRVVGPALLNPRAVGVAVPPRATLHRELLLINKLGLALGHGALPTRRDEHLQPLGAYVAARAPRVAELVRRACVLDAMPSGGLEPDAVPPGAVKRACVRKAHRCMHALLAAHIDSLGAAAPALRELLPHIASRSWLDRIAAFRSGGELPRLLQRQRAALDTGAYAQTVYAGPPRPRRVIHYIARGVIAERVDLVLFVAQLQRVVVAMSAEPFDMLIDLTGTQNDGLVSQDAFAFFLASWSALPYMVFFLNASSAALERIRQWGATPDSNPFLGRLGTPDTALRCVCGSSRADLDAAFAPGALILPPFTQRILDAPRTPIGHAVVDDSDAPRVPVQLYTLDELLIVRSAHALRTAAGLATHTTDIYALADLVVDALDAPLGILRLVQRPCAAVLWLYGSSAHHIAHELRAAQWLAPHTPTPAAQTTHAPHTRASLVPLMLGTALAHTAAHEPRLRAAARELLACALGSPGGAADLARLAPADACTVVCVMAGTAMHRAHGTDVSCLDALMPLLGAHAAGAAGGSVAVRHAVHELLGLHIHHPELRAPLHRHAWTHVRADARLTALLVDVFFEIAPAAPAHVLDAMLGAMATAASPYMHARLLAQPPPADRVAARLHAALCAAARLANLQ